MNLQEELSQEQQKLQAIAEKTRRNLENAPAGTLRLGKDNGCVQYYHHIPGGPHNGTYIPKNDTELAQQLAQKSYDEKVVRYAEKSSAQIGRLLKTYDDNRLEEIFLQEHPERQKLIVPVEPTFQQKLDAWIAKPYNGMGFKENLPVILTNNGLRVRSKSEKILADYFDSVGILYKYECPLYLEPYGWIYPDFTFLSRKTELEMYWEHEGMMDSPEYARTAVQKLELYQSNGIFPGERLILTFETTKNVLSTTLLKQLTEKYLL